MSIELFGEHVGALQRIETRMGVLASVLSDMADALTSYPDGIMIKGTDVVLPPTARVRIDANAFDSKEYPSIEEIQKLLCEWHHEMHRARQAWTTLPASAREVVLPPGAECSQALQPCV